MAYLIGVDNPSLILDFLSLIGVDTIWLLLFIIFNPIMFALTIIVISYRVIYNSNFRNSDFWRKHKRKLIATAAVLFGIDSALAAYRHLYSWSLPTEPVIYASVQTPQRLVLVNLGCRTECKEMLHSGVFDEVFLVNTSAYAEDDDRRVRRVRPGFVEMGQCPRHRRQFAFRTEPSSEGKEFCPLYDYEGVTLPTEGLFFVWEHFAVGQTEPAQRFRPTYLQNVPSIRAIRFASTEAQLREGGEIRVLAQATRYQGPGFLVPIFVGCWMRPGVDFSGYMTLPPGDTRCGFWRLLGWQGGASPPRDWIYSVIVE